MLPNPPIHSLLEQRSGAPVTPLWAPAPRTPWAHVIGATTGTAFSQAKNRSKGKFFGWNFRIIQPQTPHNLNLGIQGAKTWQLSSNPRFGSDWVRLRGELQGLTGGEAWVVDCKSWFFFPSRAFSEPAPHDPSPKPPEGTHLCLFS